MGSPGSNWIGYIIPNTQNGIESMNTSTKKVKIEDSCLFCTRAPLLPNRVSYTSSEHGLNLATIPAVRRGVKRLHTVLGGMCLRIKSISFPGYLQRSII